VGCPAVYLRILGEDRELALARFNGEELLFHEAESLGLTVPELKARRSAAELERLIRSLQHREWIRESSILLGITQTTMTQLYEIRNAIQVELGPFKPDSNFARPEQAAAEQMRTFVTAMSAVNKTGLHRAGIYRDLASTADLAKAGIDVSHQASDKANQHHLITSIAASTTVVEGIEELLHSHGLLCTKDFKQSISSAVTAGLVVINMSKIQHAQMQSTNNNHVKPYLAQWNGPRGDARNRSAGYQKIQQEQLVQSNGYGLLVFERNEVLQACGPQVIYAMLESEACLSQMQEGLIQRIAGRLTAEISRQRANGCASIPSDVSSEVMAERIARSSVASMGLCPSSWSPERQERYNQRQAIYQAIGRTVDEIAALGSGTVSVPEFMAASYRLKQLHETARRSFASELRIYDQEEQNKLRSAQQL